jgi:ABC-type Fe3+/spermidine/putrescine transport system ATPase subunit
MVAGFATPDEGEILLDGERINDVPPWRRDVGLVFQNYALWPHMSVFENVAFGLRERRLRAAEIRERVLSVLELVGLEGLGGRRPSQLSGGQQQRVALARTLVIRPRLLLLDEPLSNLDAQLRAQMRLELLRLQREVGITSVYVTHDQEEALALSTRVAILNRGVVVQEGTPQEIYRAPANRFVAEFIGAANLLEGSLEGSSDGLHRVRLEGGPQLLARRAGSPLPVGDRLLLCLRPEAVTVLPKGVPSAMENRLSGRVKTAVFEGARMIYELEVVDGLMLRAEVNTSRDAPVFEAGQEVGLAFAPEDFILIPR